MRRFFRTGVIVAALMCLGSGVAVADPVPLADVTQSANTDDGWRVSSTLTEMTINSVPNMAATAFTREGFVTVKALANIDGNGKVPVNSGTLIVGLQLGCQIDLSEGANVGLSGDFGIGDNGFGSGGTGLLSILQPEADIEPSFSVNLLPGTITNIGLGKKTLKGRTGEISVHDAHVKVDACGGPVSIRFFVSAQISTDTSDDSINAYGDILQL